MAYPVWDGIVTYVTWTSSVNSSSFIIPQGVGSVTFIMPDFATDTAATLQGLDPRDQSTWRNVQTWDPGDASFTTVTLNELIYVVVPASALGVGTFRFVNATSQTGLTAVVMFDRLFT